ncbi:Prenylated Rab acceptor 1 [Nakaseomyces bracarensis]|uniref:PRA1 family protein n=1 Tax=Nakaseomyces bracarensis TaxID=273131 RepID=A0ABR4NRE7_9SACH
MNQINAISQLANISENLSVENLKSQIASIKSKLGSLKSPQEFFNVKRISKPLNFGDAQSRIAFNLGYFSSNYGVLIGCLSVYTLLTNLLLLFVICFVVLGMVGIGKLEGQDLATPFGTFKTTQLYTGLVCIALPLGFLASPITSMLWLVGASSVTVLGHAALMEKPIETVFDEETV